MKKLNVLLLCALLLSLGCAKDELQTPADTALELRNGKRVTKPLRATISVPIEALALGTFVGFCDDQFGNFNIVDEGPRRTETKIMHLGRVSLVRAEACVRPYILDDPEVFPPDIYGPFLEVLELFPVPGVVTQDDIVTAANGKDQLHIRSTFNTFPDPDNKFNGLIEGTFEVIGGTGKFEGATGGGTLTGSASANFINPIYPYVRVYDGEITY